MSAPPARRVDYLRLSVTDRCNLRCSYCMPPEGVAPRSHDQILSYEELLTFAAAAVAAGITRVRVTGGEPLVRKGFVDFVKRLAALPGLTDLALTTNGLLLPRYAADLRAAGLVRVNVSIDSLDAGRYADITRGGRLGDALAGLDAAFAAGFSPVKLNTVLLAGIEDELDAFVALVRERDLHVRFIEYMPLDRRLGEGASFVPAGLVLERLHADYRVEPVDGPFGLGPARYYRVPGAAGTIGFIAGVSDHFCARCNRLRLMADGRLKTCLFSAPERELDVRPLIGRPPELAAAIAAAADGKNFDRLAEQPAGLRAMSQIGG
ncbi:MAG TPA: GTP 3',8-cyclase MoaA [Thermoleophilia bacterium]|nr:GTP 3',8-cyclase MoaA [Thermoleophilia bacterium]